MNLRILILLFILLTSYNNKAFAYELKNGDLIFQEKCSSNNTSDAIKNVTQSILGYNFTHIGIVYIPQGTDSIYVIEATTPRVRISSLNEFLSPEAGDHCAPISVVGRVHEAYAGCIPYTINQALTQVGKEYDYGFVLGNDKYYCSELVYEAFLEANKGIPVFELNTMTFKKNDSDQTDENWIKYFESKGLDIPEGELGINPGAMSRSKNVDILGDIKSIATRSSSTDTIHGFLTDSLGRCVHYSSIKDVVANKCYECKKYYSCYKCHNISEGHKLNPWPVYDSHASEKIVLCGNCFYEFTYTEYVEKKYCGKCKIAFNPQLFVARLYIF